ncbi:hypothetical protein [Corynebacterium sp. H130]|uniref:hypothetical protein n=1 Tax=Corynebacterium sp. H130 TaxID=3133444 RepID=UPI0030B0C1B7
MDPKRFAERMQRNLWLLESENLYRTSDDQVRQSKLSVAATWDDGEKFWVVIKIDAGPQRGYVGYSDSMSTAMRKRQDDLEAALAHHIVLQMYGDAMVQYLAPEPSEDIHWRYSQGETGLPRTLHDIPSGNSWVGELRFPPFDLAEHLNQNFLSVIRRSLLTKFVKVKSLTDTDAVVEARAGRLFGNATPFDHSATYRLSISFDQVALITEFLTHPLGSFDCRGPETRVITWSDICPERSEWELEGALNCLLGRIHHELLGFYHSHKEYVDSYFSHHNEDILARVSLTGFSEAVTLRTSFP